MSKNSMSDLRINQRAKNIFNRIAPVLQDWSTESLELLARRMAELDLRYERRLAETSWGTRDVDC